MNEIRFRASEYQLYVEQMRRRESHNKCLGPLHCPCDKCGSYDYVMYHFDTGTFECERCWAERRHYEIVDGVSNEE